MKKELKEKKGTWRAIVGILFIIGAFGCLKDSFSTFLFGFIIGLALLIWYLWPNIRNHLKAYQIREDKKRAEEERIKQEEDARMLRHHTCKSCGANFQGPICPYCRTPVPDPDEN